MDRGRRYQQLIETESAFFRRPGTNRMFMIQNATGDEAYQLVPGTNDGSVTDNNGNLTDTFGAGDFWLMRFKGTADSPASSMTQATCRISSPNKPMGKR